MSIQDEVINLLKIVTKLQKDYPKKKFTLDGRLVGDIGEILAEEKYDFRLYNEMIKEYDGETKDGKKIQVKATMKNSLTFPADSTPEYYIGIKIDNNGNITEIYNGPGKIIRERIRNHKRPKNGLHNIGLSLLLKLNKAVPKNKKISTR